MDTTNTQPFREEWGRIQSRLRAELGDDVFTSWFGRVELETFDGAQVQFSVPTRFLKNWLESHYSERVLNCCRTELNGAQTLHFHVRQPRGVAQANTANGITVRSRQFKDDLARPKSFARPLGGQEEVRTEYEGFEGSPLDRRFTFESFVVGNSNRMAHAAAWQVAQSVFDAPLQFNPLYIHSTVGLGKTHLLHAIAWEVRKRDPRARVLYLTAERFMYSFVGALRDRDALAFKDKLRGIDVLLIDDMEFLQGKTIQQEFGHTLNSLIDGGKQVVVASDRAPTLLESLDARMRSRLAGGLVTEISALDYDLRMKILARRAQEKGRDYKGFRINDDVLTFLAERLTESGRELEGAITRIAADFQFAEEPISIDRAEHIVRDLMRGKEPKRVKIDDILRIVAKHYGVSRVDILSERRTRSIVWPRQIGMYLAKQMTTRSLPEIGRRFGGRDHTTVLHAIRKISGKIEDNPTLKEEIEILKRLLKD